MDDSWRRNSRPALAAGPRRRQRAGAAGKTPRRPPARVEPCRSLRRPPCCGPALAIRPATHRTNDAKLECLNTRGRISRSCVASGRTRQSALRAQHKQRGCHFRRSSACSLQGHGSSRAGRPRKWARCRRECAHKHG